MQADEGITRSLVSQFMLENLHFDDLNICPIKVNGFTYAQRTD